MKEETMSNLQLVLKEDIEKLTPQAILFNYEELKAEINAQLTRYRGRIYSEDQTDEAKKDRATLNKFATNLNSFRIDLEKTYNKPFTEFKNRVSELITSVKEVAGEIDEGIKRYEAEKAEEKKASIKEYFDFAIGDYKDHVTFEQIFNEKWLNKSYKDTAIKEDIDQIVANINNALTAIRALNSSDEAYLISFYFRTLDLAAALTENARLQEDRKSVEVFTKKEESQPIAPKTAQNGELTIRFEASGTPMQMKALKEFLLMAKIVYKKI